MSADDMMLYSKIAALLMFAPMFAGIAIWAYLPSKKAEFERLATIALQDD